MQGIVKKFFPDRGFGFISRDDGAGDVFVHATDLESGLSTLTVGDRVSFETEPAPRGPRAIDVSIVE